MNKLLRILVMFAVILTACSRRSDFTDALRCADAVLCEHPDSALAILQALDTNGISDSQRAHYALLDAKASDKSYIIQTDASPIARAADYYRGHGDSLEVQSAYYYGLALMIEKDYKNALSELTEAFDIAEKAGDNFYQGMATRELAGVYHSLLMSKESLYWAEIAKDRFIKANKPVHAAWLVTDIAEYYNIGLRTDEALRTLQSVDTLLMQQDQNFRHQVWRVYSNAYLLARHHNNSIIYRLKLLEEQGFLLALDWAKLAYSYYRSCDYEASLEALNNAKELQRTKQDSLYVIYLDALFAERMPDKGEAYKLAMKWADDYANAKDDIITKPQTTYLIDYLNLKAVEKKKEAQRSKNVLILWVIISLLIVVILFFVIQLLRNRLKVKSAQEAELYMSIKKLEQEIVSSKTNNIGLKTELQKLFKGNFSQLDALCQIWWDSSVNSKISFKKLAIQSLQELRTPDMLHHLIDLINQYCDGWFDRFKRDFPELTDTQYRLAAYLFVGFSTESIAIIMDKTTPNAVFSAKKRLKHSISKYANPDVANQYLLSLNLKANSSQNS